MYIQQTGLNTSVDAVVDFLSPLCPEFFIMDARNSGEDAIFRDSDENIILKIESDSSSALLAGLSVYYADEMSNRASILQSNIPNLGFRFSGGAFLCKGALAGNVLSVLEGPSNYLVIGKLTSGKTSFILGKLNSRIMFDASTNVTFEFLPTTFGDDIGIQTASFDSNNNLVSGMGYTRSSTSVRYSKDKTVLNKIPIVGSQGIVDRFDTVFIPDSLQSTACCNFTIDGERYGSVRAFVFKDDE